MDTQFFQRFMEISKNIHHPFQELTDLNIKALQDFKYLSPEQLAGIKLPEELLEKQMQITLENSHKALDYMKKSFKILENTMAAFAVSPRSMSTMSAMAPMSQFSSLKKLMEENYASQSMAAVKSPVKAKKKATTKKPLSSMVKAATAKAKTPVKTKTPVKAKSSKVLAKATKSTTKTKPKVAKNLKTATKSKSLAKAKSPARSRIAAKPLVSKAKAKKIRTAARSTMAKMATVKLGSRKPMAKGVKAAKR